MITLGEMQISGMLTMTVLAFFVPLVIFMNGAPLVVFSVAYFFSISYSVISLYSYGISKDVERVEEAESLTPSPSPKGEGISNPLVKEAVAQWIESGHYREHNLSLGIVARQMGISQKQLQEWLRQSEYKKLAGLVTTLRIAEAQRVLKEHPEWSVESVSDYCGFNDRKYFHQVFLQHTGTTPAKFIQES